jgi:hypothetical protein
MAKHGKLDIQSGDGNYEGPADKKAWDSIIHEFEKQLDTYKADLKKLLAEKPPSIKKIQRLQKTIADLKVTLQMLKGSRKKKFGA